MPMQKRYIKVNLQVVDRFLLDETGYSDYEVFEAFYD